MKVRYSINERGELVARDGSVLGKLTSLTLEVVGQGGTIGGVGGPNTEHQVLSPILSERTEGGVGETKNGMPLDVGIAWAYWIAHRQPRYESLEASQALLIRKGIDAVGLEGLKRAIDGLLASDWHREHKQLQLSTILRTRPGGATLRDQIESFIERSPVQAQETEAEANANERQRRLDSELAKLEQFPDSELRPGDIARRDELRAQRAELGLA